MLNSKKVAPNELEFIRVGSSIRQSQLTVIIAWFWLHNRSSGIKRTIKKARKHHYSFLASAYFYICYLAR
jgi:hypothetical protein